MPSRNLFVFLFLLFGATQSMSQGLLGGEKYDRRVKASLDKLEFKYTITDDNDFRLGFDMGNGRTQIVFVNSNTERLDNFEIREIWSIGYKSDESDFPSIIANQLLQKNSKSKIGFWAKHDNYAIFSVQISAEADPDSLKSAISAVTNQADSTENELSGKKDEF